MSYIVAVGSPGRCRRGPDDDASLPRACALFRALHRFDARYARRGRCSRVIPEVLVIGRLKGVIYSSDRGHRGRARTYIHFMETPPTLACDPGGTQLYVIGGRYRVTPRGIEG